MRLKSISILTCLLAVFSVNLACSEPEDDALPGVRVSDLDAGSGPTTDVGAPLGACLPADPEVVSCTDMVRAGESAWRWETGDDAVSTLALVSNDVLGGSALRFETESANRVTLRFEPSEFPDLSGKDVLHMAVRASNDHSQWAWSRTSPRIRLVDAEGAVRTVRSTRRRLPKDGVIWDRIELPLDGAAGWITTDEPQDAFQLDAVRALELEFRAHGPGFWIEIDMLGATKTGELCSIECASDCNGRGVCSPAKMRCECEFGATGNTCGLCAEGFVLDNGHCRLENDGDFDVWPNEIAPANSAPWLVAHHRDVAIVRPRVLVLNFANPVPPQEAKTLMEAEFRATARASSYLGHKNPDAPAQVEYELVDIVDLRDGVDGRPPAPESWVFETSTLFPRREAGEAGNWGVDYADFYSDEFADYYGIEDPDEPGRNLALCELFERGIIHELWFLQRPHADDVNRAEVLEFKQRYTTERNPIPGSFDRCAGNGCFDADVPACEVSARIVSKNYRRGTGCRMHTVGHNLERMTVSDTVPSFTEWFQSFAAFDLDLRYDLPFRSLYQVSCDEELCIEYPAADRVELLHRGTTLERAPWDPHCGNVHFMPNSNRDYQSDSIARVASSCAEFGLTDACEEPDVEHLSVASWADLDAVDNDCAGKFNMWWFQHMPSHGSEHRFADGRPMLSVWPFLYY